jgi:hypothetical protein
MLQDFVVVYFVDSPLVVWPVAAVLIGFAGYVLGHLGFWKEVLTGGFETRTAAWRGWKRFMIAAALLTLALRALFVLMGAFAVLTSGLQAQGLVVEKPPSEDHGYVLSALGFYAWHLLDAIPVVEVPQTLNWNVTTRLTDHLGGALLLVFKLLVILPLVAVTLNLITTLRKPTVEEST